MGTNSLDVQLVAANRRSECVVTGFTLRDEQLGVARGADARREAEAQQMHEGKDMIGEARRVGVVLLDAQVGLVVQQAVEHVGRSSRARRRSRPWCGTARTGRRCACKTSARAAAIFRVDVPGALGLAAGAEVLAVRR